MTILRTNDPHKVCAACRILSTMTSDAGRIVPELEKLAHDPDPEIQGCVRDALARLRESSDSSAAP